jgi:hypothetical protein
MQFKFLLKVVKHCNFIFDIAKQVHKYLQNIFFTGEIASTLMLVAGEPLCKILGVCKMFLTVKIEKLIHRFVHVLEYMASHCIRVASQFIRSSPPTLIPYPLIHVRQRRAALGCPPPASADPLPHLHLPSHRHRRRYRAKPMWHGGGGGDPRDRRSD